MRPHHIAPNQLLDRLRIAAYYASQRSTITYMSAHDLKEEAFLAAAEHYATTGDLDLTNLIRAGQDGIQQATRRITRDLGLGTDGGERNTGKRFWIYQANRKPNPNPHDDWLDTIAARQVFNALDDEDKRILTASISHRTGAQAQTSLGLTAGTYHRKAYKARHKALRLWFDWETAPTPTKNEKPRKTHCPAGHPYAQHGRWVQSRGKRVHQCKECDRLRQAAKRIAKRQKEQP